MPQRTRFIDGDFSRPIRISPWLTSNPLDFQPQTREYAATFCQHARNFSELPISSPFVATNDDVTPSLSGTWTLAHRGQTTAAVAVNATAAVVEAALRATALISANQILKAVTGNWPEYFAEFYINNTYPSGQDHLLAGNATSISPAYQIKIALATHADRNKGTGPVQSIRLSPANEAGKSRAPVLVRETERRVKGNGLVEWERIYCNVPADYVEYRGYNYQMQRVQSYRVLWNSWTDAWGTRHDQYVNFIRLSEYTEPLIATVAYSFCLGPQLGKKKNPLYLPYRIIHYTDSFGVEYVYAVGTPGVAEPTDAVRWKGDIWKVTNRFVSPY